MTIRHIHIVEEDDALRTAMAELMAMRANVAVHSYISAETFLNGAGISMSGVLLLDFRMSGKSGMDLLVALNRTFNRLVTIILTDHGDLTLAIDAMKLGAFDVMEKPVAPDRLQGAVDAALVKFDTCEATYRRAHLARQRIAALSAREREVLLGLIEGKPNKVIAHSLGISPRTIEIHRARLMDKMAVDGLPQALRIAFEAGLLDIVAP